MSLNMYASFLLAAVASAITIAEEKNDCLPQFVDSCFLSYSEEIHKLRINASDISIKNLCSNTFDRLKCVRDVIESDCAVQFSSVEKEDLYNWMDGLRSVYHYLCEDSFESMRALWLTTEHGLPCVDTLKYTHCVGNKTKITHIVDMMQVRMDSNECNWILIALTSCSSKLTSTNDRCLITQSVLDEILHIFIQNSKCSCKYSSGDSSALINHSKFIIKFSFAIYLRFLFFNDGFWYYGN